MRNKGEFEKASKDFDEAMKKFLPPTKLKEAWATVTTQAGAFKKILSTRTERAGKYEHCHRTAVVRQDVVVDLQPEITGPSGIDHEPDAIADEERRIVSYAAE